MRATFIYLCMKAIDGSRICRSFSRNNRSLWLYFLFIYKREKRSRLHTRLTCIFSAHDLLHNSSESHVMSWVGDTTTETSWSDDGAATGSQFRFLPKELTTKCRKLVESYHAIHGLGCLPDMLWHSDARDIIECDRELSQIFKNASKSRSAQRANDSLVLIATVIVSLEVLIRDFYGWGKRFPAAKRTAECLLADFALRPRSWFLDQYLYPSTNKTPQLAGFVPPPQFDPAVAAIAYPTRSDQP